MAQETQDVIVDANDVGGGRSAETRSSLPSDLRESKKRVAMAGKRFPRVCVYVESTSALTEPCGITVGSFRMALLFGNLKAFLHTRAAPH